HLFTPRRGVPSPFGGRRVSVHCSPGGVPISYPRFLSLRRPVMPNPVVIATWPFGQTAVRAAAPLLRQGRPALDAAVAAAQAVEDDPHVMSVGYGGLPNSVGVVQLDACVMDGRTLSCGAVAGLENVRHPAALARRVMERTPHVFLVGTGAQQFALQQGFHL